MNEPTIHMNSAQVAELIGLPTKKLDRCIQALIDRGFLVDAKGPIQVQDLIDALQAYEASSRTSV